MDWSKLKGVLGAALPVVASVLGTPLAGGAVKALCNVLGLEDDASPAELENAYAIATPEQLARLKEIDSNERIRMEEIASNEFIRAHEIAKADVASARTREVESKKTGDTEWIMKFIVIATFLIFCVLTLLPFFTTQDDFDADIIKNSLEIIKGMLWLVIGYYFGSSYSSRKKDDLIASKTNNA